MPRPRREDPDPRRAAVRVSRVEAGRTIFEFDLEVALGEIVKGLRGDVSQKDYGNSVGLDQRQISRFERFEGTNLDTISRLLNGLKEDPITFFSRHPSLRAAAEVSQRETAKRGKSKKS